MTKTSFLWIILLLISVVLVTPVLLMEYWHKIEESLDLNYRFFTKEAANEYITSLAAMVVSIILIPFFIDMMVIMEDFRTKSAR